MRRTLLLIAALVLACEGQVPRPLTAQEKRGKRLYLLTSSLSGREIPAYLADATEVPGSTLPCVNCHGYDGQGRPEGGVTPTNITWEFLTKPYGVTFPSGRKSPPYSETTLARAITMGLDPAGQKLVAVMPRYAFSREDLDDLVAYLQRLGTERDPGLTDTAIKLGTLLPATGPLAETAQAAGAVLSAYFAELNARGGVYSRRITLETAASGVAGTKRLIEQAGVFAILGGVPGPEEDQVFALAETEEVPVIAPLTPSPRENSPVDRHVFFLLSGVKDQARALARFAARDLKLEKPRLALVNPEGDPYEQVPGAVLEECKQAGCGDVAKFAYRRPDFAPAQLAADLQNGGAQAVLFLGTGEEARAFLREAAARSFTPPLLLVGSLAGREILDAPASFHRRVFLSYPSAPSDQSPEGVKEYRALADKHKLPRQHLAMQLSAYGAAKILVEGLRRAGRDLSREKLINALEGFYEFETGLSPKVTYGPNRRIGALGAYVAVLDLENKQIQPASGWIALN